MKSKQLKLLGKALLSFVFVFFPFTASAQQETVWVYDYLYGWAQKGDSIYGDVFYEWYHTIGTIEIEGKEYTAIDFESEAIPTAKQRRGAVQDIEYCLGLREENGRVLANYQDYMSYLADKYSNGKCFGDPSYIPYYQTDDGEIILYDFNMEVGDKYRHVDGHDDISVTAIDSVMLNDGSKHRRLTLSNGLILIEGIGCINSPGMLFDYLNPSSGIKHWMCYLTLFFDNVENEWWGTPSSDAVYKYSNPLIVNTRSLGIEERTLSTGKEVIHNLQGLRINGLQKGLNIVDGKILWVK